MYLGILIYPPPPIRTKSTCVMVTDELVLEAKV